jgi:hypothetical protein
MTYIFISDLKTILYFAVKTFFHSILSIFFRSVEVTGRQNIPQHGPVIFASEYLLMESLLYRGTTFVALQRLLSHNNGWNDCLFWQNGLS